MAGSTTTLYFYIDNTVATMRASADNVLVTDTINDHINSPGNSSNWSVSNNNVLYNNDELYDSISGIKITTSSLILDYAMTTNPAKDDPIVFTKIPLTTTQPSLTYKHITLPGGVKIQVESAIRDEEGYKLETQYALKTDLNNITATDISITEDDEEAQLSPSDPRE